MTEITKDKIMLECKKTLKKLINEIQKKHNLSLNKATEEVSNCFSRLCCDCWVPMGFIKDGGLTKKEKELLIEELSK